MKKTDIPDDQFMGILREHYGRLSATGLRCKHGIGDATFYIGGRFRHCACIHHWTGAARPNIDGNDAHIGGRKTGNPQAPIPAHWDRRKCVSCDQPLLFNKEAACAAAL